MAIDMLNIIFSIIPGASTAIKIGILIGAVMLFWKAIVIGLFIFIYELLLRFDLYGSLNKLIGAYLTKRTGNSFFSTNEPMGADAKKILYGLSTPFKAILNINRGILYGAFFIFLISSFPLSVEFQLQPTIIGEIFTFFNSIIVLEFPVIMFLLGIVIVDKMSDILISISGITGKI